MTLVERLRDTTDQYNCWRLRSEAADRIEELERLHKTDNGFDVTLGLHEVYEKMTEQRARIAALEMLLRRAGCIDCVHDFGADFPHSFDRDRAALLNSPDAQFEDRT